jgi:hypothetical protein
MLLRRFAGLLLAATGLSPHPSAWAATRQGEPVQVCVLAPRVEPVDEGEALGQVPVAAPTLLVVEPLQLVRFESLDGRLLWSRRAPTGRSLPTPLPWPVAPLRPGQQVLLRLQPLGAADDAFAHVRLQAAGPAVMATTAALMRTLGGGADAWMAAINRALEAGDVPLAWALLYAPQAPVSAPLQDLRQEVWRRGCG